MPKSNAQMARESMQRRRARAREAGLCYTCCRGRPSSGHVVCASCNAAVRERKRRKRQRDRGALHLRRIVTMHEEAGDAARRQGLLEYTARQYKRALAVPQLHDDDRNRIEEKLVSALVRGQNPKVANLWLERLLQRYRDSGDFRKIVYLLLNKGQQLWAEVRFGEMVATQVHALDVATASGNIYLRKLCNLAIGVPLLNIGDNELAASHLQAADIAPSDPANLRRNYHSLQATFSALAGQAQETYASFSLAIEAAQEDNHIYAIATELVNYSDCAVQLGDVDLARTCIERSLVIARSNQLGWYVAFRCLVYARLLMWMGYFERARQYITEALLDPISSIPILTTTLAEIGIPLALELRDNELLAQCARPTALKHALKSGSHLVIGPVVAAFAAMYGHQNQVHKARRLIQRALPKLSYPDKNWDLLMSVASFGAPLDIRIARDLIIERTNLPSPDVSLAFFELFEARVAARRKKSQEQHFHAGEAVRRFETLRLVAYARDAARLLPGASGLEKQIAPRMDLYPNLTAREREVVHYIVQGNTNRVIAKELGISEKTVESHVASIMNRLGIRSRHQLNSGFPG